MKMIVAVDEDNAIGWSDGRLPWRSSHDMRLFKEKTTAGINPSVVMGRKTFDSIGKALPGRRNYVLTRDSSAAAKIAAAGAVPLTIPISLFYSSVSDDFGQLSDCWLIGGAQLYNEALDAGIISELHVTRVYCKSGADVKLKHDLFNWKLFALKEQEQGRAWSLADINNPTVLMPDPGISIIKLVRTQ